MTGRHRKINSFNYGLVYEFDLIVNFDNVISDQRRLIVRYWYLRVTTEVLVLVLEPSVLVLSLALAPSVAYLIQASTGVIAYILGALFYSPVDFTDASDLHQSAQG